MPFQDVPSGSYYYAPAQDALEKNIILTCKFFYPAKELTRAEFIDLTAKVIGVTKISPETLSFTDVPKTHWAYASIETAKKYALVAGMQNVDGTATGKFEPGKLVNRAQAAVMIMKAFMQVKAESMISFSDLKDVQWALDAIKKAVTVGFFAGYPDKHLVLVTISYAQRGLRYL